MLVGKRFVQGIGRKICSVGPANDPKLIDDCLREEIQVLERFEDRAKQSVEQVHFTFHTVCEFDNQTVRQFSLMRLRSL